MVNDPDIERAATSVASPAIDTRRRPIYDAIAALLQGMGTRTQSVQDTVHGALRIGREAAMSYVQSAALVNDERIRPTLLGVPAEWLREEPCKDKPNGALALEDFTVIFGSRSTGDLDAAQARIENDMLHVTSASSFTSVIYRSFLAYGRWSYEMTLETEGLIQVGWCPPYDLLGPHWSSKLGVGDMLHTIGLDGSRERLYRGQGSIRVKSSWMSGDVVTCCLDCTSGRVSYFLNGQALWSGAFPSLATVRADIDDEAAPYYIMCPAVSGATGQRFSLNFGHAPMAFSQPGFTPVAFLPFVGTDSIPPSLEAHVLAEAACAVVQCLDPVIEASEAAAALTQMRRNLALAAILDEMADATAASLGPALATSCLRRAVEHQVQDHENVVHPLVSHLFVALRSFVPPLFFTAVVSGLMGHLSLSAHGVSFPLPSRDEQNRYARAALSLITHIVNVHEDDVVRVWPPTDPPAFDRAVAPFFHLKRPSAAIRDELTAGIDPRVALDDPRAKEISDRCGHDLYSHVAPRCEAFFRALYKLRPNDVTGLAIRVTDRQENGDITCLFLWYLLARLVLNEAKKAASFDAFLQAFLGRFRLVSDVVDQRRLGGTVAAVVHRCGRTSDLIHKARRCPSRETDPLVLVLPWVFFRCARKQFPIIMNEIMLLRRFANNNNSSSAATSREDEKNGAHLRAAIIHRGRLINHMFLSTLTEFNSLLLRVMDDFTMRAVRSVSSDEDMLVAGRALTRAQPTDAMLDMLLIPQTFIIASVQIMMLCRRTMPRHFAAEMARAPYAFRFAVVAALNPLIDHSEGMVDGVLQLTAALLSPPGPDPTPYATVIASSLTADLVAHFISKCFAQVMNDVSWSMAVNVLGILDIGNGLLIPRSTEPSDGWLMPMDESDLSETVVEPIKRAATFGLYREAIRRLNSAESLKRHQSVSASRPLDEACDIPKGIKMIVSRASWLVSELELGAQDEVSGDSRGTGESRRRLAAIFELLQRCVAALEFFVDAAGDMLIADAEATDDVSVPVPLVVQTTVEMIMLLLRDYGRPESVLNRLVRLGIPELQGVHSWHIVGPLVGILLRVLIPDGVAFAGWQLTFHKMLCSPRCSWEAANVIGAIESLQVRLHVQRREAVTVRSKLESLEDTARWRPLLEALARENRKSPRRGVSSPAATPAAPDVADGVKECAAIDTIGHLSDSSSDDFLCPICCVDQVNVEFQPCGHRSCKCCIERQLQSTQKTCFFCKAVVSSLKECVNSDAAAAVYSPPPDSHATSG